MGRSILDIAKEAVNIKGISAPTGLFIGTDDANQLLAVVQEAAINIALAADWQEMQIIFDFTTVNGSAQFDITTNDLQYRRKFIDDCLWDLTAQERMRGPLTPQAWQRLRVVNSAPLPYYFTIIGNQFLMPSTTAAGHDITLMYVDKRIFLGSDNVTKKERASDDKDTFSLGDNLLMFYIRWRYLQIKGLEYGEDFRMYTDLLSSGVGNNLPSETLNLNGSSSGSADELGPSIPEGNWSH